MNIVEEYINRNKQIVILISGFSGSGKSVLARSLLKDINRNNKKYQFTFLNLNDFYKSDDEYKNIVEVGDLKVVDWDDPDAINWVGFNKEVNKIKSNGVIVSGFAFPKDKLEFEVDFHIHLKISKDDLIKNRVEYANEKLDDKTSRISEIGEDIEKRILNKVTFPHYLKSLETSVINKFINIKYDSLKEAYDEMFDYIMAIIKKKI
jgi:ABC-type dipeptide/oligopeptide/nickel transport system ATPase component